MTHDFRTRREALAWAGGLFDGEGTLFLRNRGGRRGEYLVPCAHMVMSDLDLIKQFQAVLGFGTINFEKKKRPAHHKPLWRYAVHSHEHVQALIAFLWPFLGERRKAKAKEILSAYNAARA